MPISATSPLACDLMPWLSTSEQTSLHRGCGQLSLACKYKGSEELDASYDAVSIHAYQPSAFLAYSLPLLSHHPFPPFLVVGPHRSLLSPGPLVTSNNQHGALRQAWKLCENQGQASLRGSNVKALHVNVCGMEIFPSTPTELYLHTTLHISICLVSFIFDSLRSTHKSFIDTVGAARLGSLASMLLDQCKRDCASATINKPNCWMMFVASNSKGFKEAGKIVHLLDHLVQRDVVVQSP